MARSNYLLLPSLAAFALFSACGSDGGDQFNTSAGSTSTDAGTSSVAGDSAVAGDNSGGAGSESAGASGSGEAGVSGSADGQAGGVGEAGETGSVSGGTGGGGAGGTGHAGAGGSGGHAGSGAGSGGMSMGGTHSGGSAGSGPPEPTCAQLDTEAANQLGPARTCNSSQGFNGCDARVEDTCGCQVPVESTTSAASKTYLATLKTIAARKCPHPAGCHACVAVGFALCSEAGKGNNGTCTNFN